MSSTFNDHHVPHHPKREPNENNSGLFSPPSPSLSPSPSPPTLKVNKDSHVIKKLPSPSSSAAAAKPRHPVIIYTHTPKVIHTNPKDFMALVQKLTGMSSSDEDSAANTTTDCGGKSINRSVSDLTVDRKINRNRCGGSGINNYQRSYSGTGAGNGKGIFFNTGQVNSHIPYSSEAITPPPPPSMYDAAGNNYGAYIPTVPIFPPANPADNFFCGNLPFENLDDPVYFGPNMRNSFSSFSGFDGMTEFRDF